MKRIVALALAAAPLLALPTAGQEQRWRTGERLAEASSRASRAELVGRLEQGDAPHVLVRFERSPSRHEKELWRAAGLDIGRALGAGAYFANVRPVRPEGLDRDGLARLPGLVDVRAIALEWKLDPLLASGETPPWTVVARVDGEPTVALYVLLHDGVGLERGDELLRSFGGSTLDRLESVGGLVALLPRTHVAALAAADEVAWVEAALPRMEEVALAASAPAPNDSNRALVQADLLQAAPYELDGSGVNVLVYDGGTARATHLDFGGRCNVRDGSPQITHATLVAATLAGSGAASGGTYRGMAPAATIQSYGFEFDFTGLYFFTNPGDFEHDYDEAMNVHGAVLANNSIVSNVEPNGFHCPIQGDYGVMCSLIDGVVHGSLGAPWRIVWASGNERVASRCDIEGFGAYYSVPPPATAKNHITVGALNSNDDSMTYFSSWGPTDDGRLKPDLCAPGCEMGGDGGVTSATADSDSSYGTACGTSLAAPTVCGVAALLIEDWRAHFGAPDPLNSTLKVLFAETAVDLGSVGPDYQFGYGSVRARDALERMRMGLFAEGALEETGAYARWKLSVEPDTSELRLTLAWDDAPAQPNVFGSLVNDLDLEVRDSLGVRHHVWTLDPTNPSATAMRTQPDRLNNIEQVLVDLPMSGTWTVEVRAHDLASGPQTFSLASSHALAPVPHVSISFQNSIPTVLTPGLETELIARIVGVDDLVLGGTPTLHVRYDDGPFLEFKMTGMDGGLYSAELPPPACTAVPEFYVSARGATSGTVTHPSAAPSEVHRALVASRATVIADSFQTNLGWTVSDTNLFLGSWERGVPQGDGTRGDPLTAWGGSGRCYVTDKQRGLDVDGGPTRLLSPVLDLSGGGEFEVSYVRWFTNDAFGDDALTVEISNDDGASWTTVENVTGSGGGWVRRTFLVGDHVAPTAEVRLRFSVSDDPDDSVTEAGLDDFSIVRRTCANFRDCNANGITDANDISSGRSADADLDGVPDECSPLPRTKTLPNAVPPRAGPNVRAP